VYGVHVIFSTLFGDEPVLHYCKKCKTHKPVGEFVHRDRASNGLKPINSCRECDKKASQQLKIARKSTPKPPTDHICPLCLRGREELGYTSAFVLDHDHITGDARGWICHDCNTALARIHDNSETAKRMVSYIESKERSQYLGYELTSLESAEEFSNKRNYTYESDTR
jgi:hypothetical protein